jgi:hypothetical protein
MSSRASSDTVAVNDSQRRHLAVFLAQVEDAVAEVERLATSPSSSSRLRTDDPDLPRGFGAAVSPEIERVRAGLVALADRLGLAPLQQSRAREVQGLLSIAIVQLEDAGSRGLKGYGAVDPRLPALLDPALQELRAGLARILAMLSLPPSSFADDLSSPAR